MCQQELDKSRRRVHDAMYQTTCGINSYNVLLAELWLRLESCQLVGLPATSIKQQATGSKGESDIITSEVAMLHFAEERQFSWRRRLICPCKVACAGWPAGEHQRESNTMLHSEAQRNVSRADIITPSLSFRLFH